MNWNFFFEKEVFVEIFVWFQLASQASRKQLLTPTPRLWTICWLFLCLFRWVASRLIFFVFLFNDEEKSSFINIFRWRAFLCEAHSWNLNPSLLKIAANTNRGCEMLKSIFYHTKFEYSMKLTQTRKGRQKIVYKIGHLAPNKRQIGWSNNHLNSIRRFKHTQRSCDQISEALYCERVRC